MNKSLIENFEKLIKQVQSEIDNSTDKKKKMKQMFRLLSINKVLKIIKAYSKKITSSKQLIDFPGVGTGSANRIDEILQTGKLSEINEEIINQKYLEYLIELEKIYGIGRITALELFKKYNITSIDMLKKLYIEKKIDLPDNIIKGLKYHGIVKDKIPQSEVDDINSRLHDILLSIDPELLGVICGSYRRMLPTSNDIDMMVVHPRIITKKGADKSNYLFKIITKLIDEKFIIDSLTGTDVISKYMGYCRLNKNSAVRRLDIRFIPYESYYCALFYFTGSGEFNKKMRSLAIDMNYLLNEYGLFNENNEMICVNSELEIFKILNLEYVSPEFRK